MQVGLTAFCGPADGETIIKKAVGARQLPRAERKKELNCMKIKKGRLFSAVLCAAVLLGVLPQTTLAAQTVIPEVRIEGMSEVSIKKAVKAAPVKLTCPGSDEILKIDEGKWYRACDDAKLSSNYDTFDSGTEYYYRFKVIIKNGNYVVNSSTAFYIDDEPVPQENIDYYAGYLYIKTKNLCTEGVRKNYLDSLELMGVQQPGPNSSVEELTQAVKVSAGRPYSIWGIKWKVYDPIKKSYVNATSFKNTTRCTLTVTFDFEEGFGMSRNTQILLTDGAPPREIRKSTVGVNKPSVTFEYTIKSPKPNTITLDANGGSFVGAAGAATLEMQTGIDGTIMSLHYDHTVINREGFYLEGWYTEPEGGERVDLGRVYNKDTTIYAQWKPIIKELRLYNIEPMPGRKPVFYPLGTSEYTVMQIYEDDDGNIISDNEAQNALIAGEAEYSLLEEYTENTVYEYGAYEKATGDAWFTAETKLYINDVSVENHLSKPSRDIHIRREYTCAEASEFKVYNLKPVEIPASVSGSSINVDLKNYISCADSYTVTGDAEFAAYGLSITGNRYITGVYPSAATEEKSFTLTVTSGDESKDLPVHIGRTETAPFIESLTDKVVTECDRSAAFHIKVCAPKGATVTYDWQLKQDSAFISIKQLVDYGVGVGMFVGYETPAFVITNRMPGSETYRCVVKVNGEEVTKGVNGNLVSHSVRHIFDSCTPKDGTNHSLICSRCSYEDESGNTVTYKKDEEHIYKYELLREATDTVDGLYRKTCAKCEYQPSAVNSFTKSDMQSSTVLFLFDKREAGSQPYKTIRMKMYNKVILPNVRPIKNGYSFLGWTVDKNGKTVDYLPGDEVFVPMGLSLYAVFAEPIITVGGESITQDNAEALFGGAVSFTPETSMSPAKLTLNNAHIDTHPIYATAESVGIYANGDLDIELTGDSIIEADTIDAVGILCGGKVSFYGSGTLTINGAGKLTYDKGIKATKIENLAEKLSVRDCKTAFDGKTMLAYGITEIYWGNYNGTSFKAFTQMFTQSEYSPMKVVGAKNSDELSVIMSDPGDVPNAWYALIAPEDAAFISYNKELNTVIGFAPDSSARLHSAKYDANGNLVNYLINYVNQEDYYLKGTPGDGYVYKLMLWGHESQGMQPLCDVVTVE